MDGWMDGWMDGLPRHVRELDQASSSCLLPHEENVHLQESLHLVLGLLVAALRRVAVLRQQQQHRHYQRVATHHPKSKIQI